MAVKRCCFCLRYKWAGIITSLLNGGFYAFFIVFCSFNFTSFANTNEKIQNLAIWCRDHMLEDYKYIPAAILDSEKVLKGWVIAVLVIAVVLAIAQASLFYGSNDEVACLILPWIVTQAVVIFFLVLLTALTAHTCVVFKNKNETEKADELMVAAVGFGMGIVLCGFFLFWMSLFYRHLRNRDAVTPIMVEPVPDEAWADKKNDGYDNPAMEDEMDKHMEKAKGLDEEQRVFSVTDGASLSKREGFSTEFSSPSHYGMGA